MAHPTPNLRWFAIFADQPEAIVEIDEPGDLLARFDTAMHLGHHGRRRIKGMWIIRGEGDGADVLRIHGLVPVGTSVRFHEARRHQAR